MFRTAPAGPEELDVLMKLQKENLPEEEITAREILEYRCSSFGKWLRLCCEEDRVYGFLSARPVNVPAEKGISDEMFLAEDMEEGSTMAILNLVTDKKAESLPCSPHMADSCKNLREEIHLLLLRVLIIESRMTGEYVRVLITVPESRREYFVNLGFHELGPSETTIISSEEPLYDMEYFLNTCQGNCSFCRAC